MDSMSLSHLDLKTGKVLKRKLLETRVLAKPLYFKSSLLLAANSSLYEYDINTFKLKSTVTMRHDDKKNRRNSRNMFAANLSFNGKMLSLWGISTDMHGYGRRTGMLFSMNVDK